MARASATSQSWSSGRQSSEGQADPARADGGGQPVLASDQVLAVSPLGLATLAAYLGEDDDVEIQDQHVEVLDLDDAPDLVFRTPTTL